MGRRIKSWGKDLFVVAFFLRGKVCVWGFASARNSPKIQPYLAEQADSAAKVCRTPLKYLSHTTGSVYKTTVSSVLQNNRKLAWA